MKPMTLLAQHKVSDLPLPFGLISLRRSDDTLFSAIDLLAEHHLLSAPVLSPDELKVLGILDALDVVAHIVKIAAAEEIHLRDEPVDRIMGLGYPGGGNITEVSMEDPVDKVLDIISGPARRAIVLSEQGHPHSIVTQSAMLQFLYAKRDQLEGLSNCGSAQELCSDGAVCINEDESALSAFQLINSRRVWSIAIVDEDGCMVAVCSATDLVISLSHMDDKSTAMELLVNCSVTDLVANNRSRDLKEKASTVIARPEQSLGSILQKLAICRVHRVFVCAERKPVGVLSLTDICRIVASSDLKIVNSQSHPSEVAEVLAVLRQQHANSIISRAQLAAVIGKVCPMTESAANQLLDVAERTKDSQISLDDFVKWIFQDDKIEDHSCTRAVPSKNMKPKKLVRRVSFDISMCKADGPLIYDADVRLWYDALESADGVASRSGLESAAALFEFEEEASKSGVAGALVVMHDVNWLESDSKRSIGVSSLCKALASFPDFFRGIGTINSTLVASSVEPLLLKFRDLGFVGVQMNLWGHREKYGSCPEEDVVRSIFSLAGKFGLVVFLCATDCNAASIASHVSAIQDLLELSPSTNVVIDNFCHPPVEDDRERAFTAFLGLARFPQVCVKISGRNAASAAEGVAQMTSRQEILCCIERVVDAFTSKRTLWGSGAPVAILDRQGHPGHASPLAPAQAGYTKVCRETTELLAATRLSTDEQLDVLFRTSHSLFWNPFRNQ